MVDYVEQRSSDLCLYLLERPAPRESVRVLVERTVALPSGRATLAIIGSSHFLEIAAGNLLLCEMLVCPGLGSAEMVPTACLEGRSRWCHELRRHGVSYRLDLWRRRYSPAGFERQTGRLSAARPDRLRFRFPGRGPLGAAVTCLDWQLQGGRMAVFSSHTFPAESTIVRTRSVVDVAEAGAEP